MTKKLLTNNNSITLIIELILFLMGLFFDSAKDLLNM